MVVDDEEEECVWWVVWLVLLGNLLNPNNKATMRRTPVYTYYVCIVGCWCSLSSTQLGDFVTCS